MALPVQKVPLVCSHRLILAVMAFFGNFFVYVARVNLSVAILCMVQEGQDSNLTSLGDFTTANGTMSPQEVEPPTHEECGRDIPTSGNTVGASSGGEFDWDKSQQSQLLSMYFYGYIFTQIPGGWLASRFGGQRIWGVCMFISAVCSLLTPLAARVHIHLASSLRFILGVAAGVTFPCVHALLGRWAPPYERSKLASCTFGGPLVGLVATFSISGILCEQGFDNGWGSIFYLTGIFYLVWVVLWFPLSADGPEVHKRISPEERDYITASIGKSLGNEKPVVPWLKMFRSGPLWAIIIAHFCNNYTNYTLLTSLPMFMKESLKFDIKQNGVLSSLPYVANFCSSLLYGYLADTINERGWLSVRNQRKLFQSISFLGTGAGLCLVVQMDCSQRYVAVGLLCLCTSLLSANKGAYLVNHLDLAPRYAGVLFGITNTAATIPGMIAPTVAGALTPNGTAEEWRKVFYVCAAVCAVGAVLYIILADGQLQEWAGTKEYVIDVEADDSQTKGKEFNAQKKDNGIQNPENSSLILLSRHENNANDKFK